MSNSPNKNNDFQIANLKLSGLINNYKLANANLASIGEKK